MSQKRTGSQTRELIFQACGEILRTQGAKRLTLEAVAREAGLSKGGLLYHFPSKEILVEQLFKYHAEKFDKHLAKLSDANLTEKGGWLKAYLLASLEEILDPGNAGLFASLFAAGEEFPWVHKVMQQRYVAWQQHVENCGLEPVLATLIRLTVDGLWFSEIYQYAPPNPKRRDQIIELVFKLINQDALPV